MSTDIARQTTTFQVANRQWLKSQHGTDYTPGVTLDVSKFTDSTHYPNGFIPNGTALGKVTASGLYGPYDNSANDGREVFTGLLYGDCRVTRQNGSAATRVGSGQLIHGFVEQAKLPFQSGAGSVDSSAKTDNPLIRYV
jgi:hypothetical protein